MSNIITSAAVGRLRERIAELEAENSELTTWWKFEEACKNRACSKELDYIERITALESAAQAVVDELEYTIKHPLTQEAVDALKALLGVQK